MVVEEPNTWHSKLRRLKKKLANMSGSFFSLSPLPFFPPTVYGKQKRKQQRNHRIVFVKPQNNTQRLEFWVILLSSHFCWKLCSCVFIVWNSGLLIHSPPDSQRNPIPKRRHLSPTQSRHLLLVQTIISVRKTLMRHPPEPTLTHFSPSNRKTIEYTHPHTTSTYAWVKMIGTCPFFLSFFFLSCYLLFVCKEIIYYYNKYL